MLLGALAAVAALSVVQVHNAEELVAAIGPQRTIRLAPGSYDLSAVNRRDLPFIRWEAPQGTAGITVHDVEGLTIEGPADGAARWTTGAAFRLRFEAVRGLTLRRIGIGRGPDERLPRYRTRREYIEQLAFKKVDTVLLDAVRWSEGSVQSFVLEDARHVVVRRVDLAGDYPVQLRKVSDFHLEDSWLRPGTCALSVSQVSDVVLANLTIFAPMRPDVRMEEQLPTPGDTTLGLVNVRMIDAASGKLRRTITEAAFHRAYPPPTRAAHEVPFLIVRRGPWKPHGDDPTQMAFLRLEDGREPMQDFPAAGGESLETSSVRVDRLGSSTGPIAVTWDTRPQGNGAYSDAYYRILAGRPGGPLLLGGSYGASGSQGASSGSQQTRTFAFENGLLTVRGSITGIDGYSAPGLPLEQDDEEGTHFMREWSDAFELIYRLDGDRLVPVRYEEYERIEPATDVAAKIAEGARPSWPHLDGTPPRVGEWLKRIVPLQEGARKYPTIDLTRPEQP